MEAPSEFTMRGNGAMVKARRKSTNPKSNYDMKVPKIGQKEIQLSKQTLNLLRNGEVNPVMKVGKAGCYGNKNRGNNGNG